MHLPDVLLEIIYAYMGENVLAYFNVNRQWFALKPKLYKYYLNSNYSFFYIQGIIKAPRGAAIYLNFSNIECLKSINGLKGICGIKIDKCPNLRSITDLNNLEYIKVSNCGRLFYIQGINNVEEMRLGNLQLLFSIDKSNNIGCIYINNCTVLTIFNAKCRSLNILDKFTLKNNYYGHIYIYINGCCYVFTNGCTLEFYLNHMDKMVKREDDLRRREDEFRRKEIIYLQRGLIQPEAKKIPKDPKRPPSRKLTKQELRPPIRFKPTRRW